MEHFLGPSYGVCRTAEALRLEYKKLKQLSDGGVIGRRVRPRAATAATFIGCPQEFDWVRILGGFRTCRMFPEARPNEYMMGSAK